MATERRVQRIRDVVAQRQAGFVVVLEDIHDPHNAEAILRSCDAFGVQEVYLIFDKHTPWNPRKVGKQSSSSAHKWLDFHIFRSTKACLKSLKRRKYKIVATSLQEQSKSPAEIDLRAKKLALLVGNEHSGLSAEALALADSVCKIPMRGMIESFNVSVATALFLYEITRQRSEKAKAYGLSAKEKLRLEEDFLRRGTKRAHSLALQGNQE